MAWARYTAFSLICLSHHPPNSLPPHSNNSHGAVPGTGLSGGHPHLHNSSQEPSPGPGLKELSSVWGMGTRRPSYERPEDKAEFPSSGVSASFLQRARGKRQRPGESCPWSSPPRPSGIPWPGAALFPGLRRRVGGLGKQVSDFADVGLKLHFPIVPG